MEYGAAACCYDRDISASSVFTNIDSVVLGAPTSTKSRSYTTRCRSCPRSR
uniref:hypothetical protein n=1 Tax=Sutcliffiella horikoshii TaxID=79883 RepID=UPI003709BBA0